MPGIDVQISNKDAMLILERNLNKYQKSSIFLFMKGKYMSTIKRDFENSLKCYDQARLNAAHIQKIQFLAVYEIAWLHLRRMDFVKALEFFRMVETESKWYKWLSAYICALLEGCLENFEQANAFVLEANRIFILESKKNHRLDLFTTKRNEYLKENGVKSKDLCEILIVEVLYFWLNFPSCEEIALNKMLNGNIDKIKLLILR